MSDPKYKEKQRAAKLATKPRQVTEGEGGHYNIHGQRMNRATARQKVVDRTMTKKGFTEGVDLVLQAKRRRQAKREAKRIATIKRKYGDDAFKKFSKQNPNHREDAAKGGRVSPTNFKNNKELASRAGSISRPTIRRVKI